MLGPLAVLLAIAAVPELAPAADPEPVDPAPVVVEPDDDAPAEAEPAPTVSPADPSPPPATPEPPPPPPIPLPPPPPSAERRPERQEVETWLDSSHAFVEHRLFAPALRIDRFFSDERDLEPERARSFLRWRNEVRFVEDASSPGFRTSISATLRLPGLNKQLRRLRIEIAGETRDAFSAIFPGETVEPGEVPAPDENLGTADAGLRFSLWDTIRTHGDVSAGMLLRLPPGSYLRLRLRFAQPLDNRFLARQALSGFWRTDTGFGTTASAELERPFAPTVLARLSGSTTVTEVSRGFEWLGDLSLLATMRGRLGVQVGAGVTGATSAPIVVERYRVYTRLRRDFYRRWIFLEIEPEYGWPWSPELGRFRQWAIALRFEVQFHGNEMPPAAIPPPPAPPAADALPAPPAAGRRPS